MLPMVLSMFMDFYLVPLSKVWHFSTGKLHIICYLCFVNLFKLYGINLFLIVRTVPRYEQKTVKITVEKYSVSKAFYQQFAIIVHYLLTYLNIYLLTFLVTYLLAYLLHREESFLRNTQFAVSQKIRRNLWNPKNHYRIHKCPPTVSIMSQLNPIHSPTSHFLKTYLIIIFPFMRGSTQWSLPLRFPHQRPVHVSPLPRKQYMPRPSHSSRFYNRTIYVWGAQNTKLLIM